MTVVTEFFQTINAMPSHELLFIMILFAITAYAITFRR